LTVETILGSFSEMKRIVKVFTALLLAAAILSAAAADRRFESPEALKAVADHAAAEMAAKRTCAKALELALKSAMQGGDLAEANAIDAAKKALEAWQEPKTMEFKTASALQAKGAYTTSMANARNQYLAALGTAQKTALAQGKLKEANLIQEEMKDLKGMPEGMSAKPLPNESADLVVSGKGFVMTELKDNDQAFSNRGYVWQKVPMDLRGRLYTKVAGGSQTQIKVKAKRDTVVQVIADPQEPGVKMTGWDRTGTRFIYTNAKKSEVVLYKQKLAAGQELEIPKGSWCGALVLLPK
jgi:hypothetical protein